MHSPAKSDFGKIRISPKDRLIEGCVLVEDCFVEDRILRENRTAKIHSPLEGCTVKLHARFERNLNEDRLIEDGFSETRIRVETNVFEDRFFTETGSIKSNVSTETRKAEKCFFDEKRLAKVGQAESRTEEMCVPSESRSTEVRPVAES